MLRKRSFFALLLICLLLPGVVLAQTGIAVDCGDGVAFDNGVEVVVREMRSGFNYRATAIGVNGFNPVLAVVDEAGNFACSDDSGAVDYAAELPSTGPVPSSEQSAQLTFSQITGQPLANVSLIIGGFAGAGGEFLLVIEGMGVTAADNAGDPFVVNVTPGMVASGVPLTAYMLSRGGNLDPLMYVSDLEYNILSDGDGNEISCDDSGNSSLCWGTAVSLDGYWVSLEAGMLPGAGFDSMLSLGVSGSQIDAPGQILFQYMMTSYQQQTQGQYVLVFHIGTTGSGGGSRPGPGGGLGGGPPGRPGLGGRGDSVDPTPTPRGENAGDFGAGVIKGGNR